MESLDIETLILFLSDLLNILNKLRLNMIPEIKNVIRKLEIRTSQKLKSISKVSITNDLDFTKI
jgi:hypothetical protein